jgi:hypothetical protein
MRRDLVAALALALVCASLEVRAAGVPVAEASKDQLRAAEKTFHVADDLFDAKRYSEALTAYRASFDIVASPNSQLMMARCLIALDRLQEAYAELERAVETADAALKRDKKYANAARAVREELARVTAKVARLSIRVGDLPEGSKLTVNGKQVDTSTLDRPLILAPGSATAVLIAPDGREARREVEIAAGATASVKLDLAAPGESAEKMAPAPIPASELPPEEDRGKKVSASTSSGSSLRPWAFIAGGVGVVGLASFGIFGSMSQSKFDSLKEDCPDAHCPPDRGSDIDDGKRFQTFANVGLVVGIVGVGTGVTLFLLSAGGNEKRASRAPWIRVGAGDVHVGGRF